ncbi:hypothetical protein KP509_03G039100 [Ceratopteris richardii]|uniref:Uncharacterized protein n=1 Tax=Ceratopteris richardii TaxID=49495 RepID=A0A8T2V227_CERRI|nr:hypothetical protein KP509_03G039100 [Ceratopteris richardii]KAH7441463.1 hypothetical protein KP509_03G039100 [Ceratopteris richardii]KAH7441464.1 hypothetical protein KP509_03G039100 [Ceratopteris richardii]KAH7441465.1 hypothetical protein KP509_03G039100 [Ceratopteris richardii]KAH7441466.1 hypothetical protein KP509_03G039100 [Ceratopteris richardii]
MGNSCLSKPEGTSRGSAVAPYSSPQQVKSPRMQLYGKELCPFTCRIRIALEYKGIPVYVTWIADDDNERSKQLQAYNLPDGKLPLLQHEDHTVCGSSDEILEYIESKFPKPSLTHKIEHDWVEYVRDIFSPLILAALYNGDLAGRHKTRDELNAGFSRLDAAIQKHSSKGPYFLGDQFSLVDVYLIPFLLLERPLCFHQGISIDPSLTHLRAYSLRMTSFSSYAPIRMDLDLLHESVSKTLARNVPPPLVTMTLLQHYSILTHLEKLVVTMDELILASRHPPKSIDPVKGSVMMQLKKLSGVYSLLVQLMLEHAQMEERLIFPALEKADRGLTKTANESHARDFPLINGINEDFKSVIALEQGSPGRKEALLTVSSRLRDLKAHTIEHFQEEEAELLPLLVAAGVGEKQQAVLAGKCIEVMESSHMHLLPFMLSGLQCHHIHRYVNLMQQSLEEEKAAVLSRMLSILKQAEDDYAPSVWAVVRDRSPALACLAS